LRCAYRHIHARVGDVLTLTVAFTGRRALRGPPYFYVRIANSE
jgi:hypothetical protein